MDAFSSLSEHVHLYKTKCYHLEGNGQWSYELTRVGTLVFYLVLDGGFCLNIDGDVRIVNKGDMIMLPHSPRHKCYALEYRGEYTDISPFILDTSTTTPLQLNKGSGDCNVSLLLIEGHYNKEMAQPLLSTLPAMLPEQVQEALNGTKILEFGIQFLAAEYATDRMGKATMINRLATMLMVECLRTHIESLPETTDSWLLALKDPYLAKAISAMHEFPDKNWTINKLAEVAGMSRSSFAERFKQVVGVPPLTYLIDYRLRLAARYLRLQQSSISHISELVGYASDSTFSQAFKRVYGMSPRSYRQQQQVLEPKEDKTKLSLE